MVPDPEKIYEFLVKNGMTKSQASTASVHNAIDILLRNDACFELVKTILDDIREKARNGERKLGEIEERFSAISNSIQPILDSQDEFGEITDARARNALTLYASILRLNKDIKTSSDVSVNTAGYVLYAYLNGEQKNNDSANDDRKGKKKISLKDKVEIQDYLKDALTGDWDV